MVLPYRASEAAAHQLTICFLYLVIGVAAGLRTLSQDQFERPARACREKRTG
jgi:hypothetical protein